jgi:hypothetical protein
VGHFVPPLSVALHDVLACWCGVDRSTDARARTAFLVLYPRERGIAHLKNWRILARHLGRRWHMSEDEVFIKINGVQEYLWRAVDQDGNVPRHPRTEPP